METWLDLLVQNLILLLNPTNHDAGYPRLEPSASPRSKSISSISSMPGYFKI